MKTAGDMLRPARKNRYTDFGGGRNLPQALLLAGVFGAGLWLSLFFGFLGVVAYILLWGASYPLIYAGTCRYCAYYGKKCPVPLEGSCVQTFFSRSHGAFGGFQLFWAAAAYFLRIIMPVLAVMVYSAYISGLLYLMLLASFWVVHLRLSGCPNCINTACPLNPDFTAV